MNIQQHMDQIIKLTSNNKFSIYTVIVKEEKRETNQNIQIHTSYKKEEKCLEALNGRANRFLVI